MDLGCACCHFIRITIRLIDQEPADPATCRSWKCVVSSGGSTLNPRSCFGAGAPTSVADDPVPQRTRPKPGFLAAQSVDKQSHRTIQSQMAKSRQKIVMTFSAEGSGDQPFGGKDNRLVAHLGMPIGFSRWLSKTAVGLREVNGDQHQIVDRLFSEDHRTRSFTHRRCRANLARS